MFFGLSKHGGGERQVNITFSDLPQRLDPAWIQLWEK
jgi:hypothetical protein